MIAFLETTYPSTATPGARPPEGPRFRWSGRDRIAVLVCTVLAAVLGGWNLRGRSIWFDEAFSIGMARADLDRFLSESWREELNGFLYYLAVRPFGGSSDVLHAARAVSLVCAVLAVPLMAFVAGRLGGRRAMLAAAVLAAAHPSLLRYAVEGRSYALVVLATTAAAAGAVVAFDRGPVRSGRWWAAAGLLGAVAVYSHLFGLFAVAAISVGVAPFLHPAARRKALAAPVTFAVAGTPMAVFLTRTERSQLDWIAETRAGAFSRTVEFVAGAPGTGTIVVCAVIALLAVVGAGRRAVLRDPDRPAVAITAPLTWWVLPALIAVAVSVAVPLLVPRYLIVSVPGAVILVAVLAARLGARAAALAVAVVLAAWAVPVHDTLVDRGDERWDLVAERIAADGAPTDQVVVVPNLDRMALELAFETEVERGGLPTLPQPVYPNALPWGDEPLYGGPVELGTVAADTADTVWVVLGPQAQDNEGRVEARTVVAGRVLDGIERYGRVEVQRWVRAGT